MLKKFAILVSLLLLMAIVPVSAQNLTDSCVEEYDPNVDYFPDKAEIVYADGLEIEYFNHYKVVRTLIPFPGAAEPFEYALVQCGTPEPDGFDRVITIPVDNTLVLSTTQLPHFVELGLLDSLAGVDTFDFIQTPEVVELINADALIAVGNDANVNVELVLDAEPDVVFAFGFNPDTDAHPILTDAGVNTAINSEWLETSPLGRAEWIKFTAAFFNAEADATAVFDDIATRYEELVALTADIPEDERPTVLPNSFSGFSDAWVYPGGESYVAQLIADAGGILILRDNEEVAGNVGSVLFDFEFVYSEGLEADFWFPNAFGVNSLDDLEASDSRYVDFVAFQEGRVYDNAARVNESGGNDYFENGVTSPNVLLADLISILYPDLLPDHELVFYRQLP